MSLINENALVGVPQTTCPVGAALISSFGIEYDSIRIYELKEQRFMHVIKKSKHKTYSFKDLPQEIVSTIDELRSVKTTHHENEKKRAWVNKF